MSPKPKIPRSILALAAITATGALLRILAARNDLWFDELLSLGIVQQVRSAGEIFTRVHLDNNHYLNSLFLYLVQPQMQPAVYRGFALACGIALIPAGYWMLSENSKSEALWFAMLLAASYPLIHFASEARGYSGAALGSLLAAAALLRWHQRPSAALGVGYGAALIFAFLSHLTACFVWLPLALGSALVLARARGLRRLLPWVWLNAAPALVLAALYLVDGRRITSMPAFPYAPGDAFCRLLALAYGWPLPDAVSLALLLLALCLWYLGSEPRQPNSLRPALALVFLTPAAYILLWRPASFSPRYFLVLVPFFYLPLARVLARLAVLRWHGLLAAALAGLFLAGQYPPYARLLQVGRGQYTAALQYMAANSNSAVLTVTSNQDLRSRVELAFYRTVLPKDLQVGYVPSNSPNAVFCDWYIAHQEGRDPPGPPSFAVAGQPTWYRAVYFGAAELSGQSWTLYSHRPPPEAKLPPPR